MRTVEGFIKERLARKGGWTRMMSCWKRDVGEGRNRADDAQVEKGKMWKATMGIRDE